MVVRKHFYAVLCGLLLWLVNSMLLAADNDFNLKISQKTVQLGKPVWVNINTRKQHPSLRRLDFSSLQRQFEVVTDHNEIHQTTQGQRWRIRLYPRQQGRFSIPALAFDQTRSTAVPIQVTAPIDSKTGQAFDVEYQLSTATPWIKQQVLVSYTFTHTEPRLVLKPISTSDANALLIPLSTRTEKLAGVFKHTSGWAIYPYKPGRYGIKLPALQYIRDGVITHRFYPGIIDLKVKALPAYLPGNIPVGKLKLALHQPSGLVLKNRLESLRLTLTGHGIPQVLLPDIRHMFKSSQQLQFYPVDRSSQQTAAAGIISQHDYQVPFKSLEQGSLTLPDIRLHYFDPATGKLASISLQQRPMFSMASWFLIPMLIVIAVLSLLAVIALYRWRAPKWQCLRSYQRVLQSLPTRQTPRQFKLLVQQLSLAEGWSGNISLRQWSSHNPAASLERARQICAQLEAGLYRGEGCDSQTLQGLFRQLCLLRWPILAWMCPI